MVKKLFSTLIWSSLPPLTQARVFTTLGFFNGKIFQKIYKKLMLDCIIYPHFKQFDYCKEDLIFLAFAPQLLAKILRLNNIPLNYEFRIKLWVSFYLFTGAFAVFGGYANDRELATMEYLNETAAAWVIKPHRSRHGQAMVLLPCP